MASTQAVVSRAMAGMKWLVALQLFTRILNFLIGVLVTERVLRNSPGVVGVRDFVCVPTTDTVVQIGNSQLVLLLSMALFWTREGFRKACIREGRFDIQAQVNVTWLTVPLGVVVSIVACSIFLLVSTEKEFAVPDFQTAVWVTGVNAIIELLSEPLYIHAQNSLLFSLRNSVETTAILARTFTLALLILQFKMGVLAYALAQLAYAITTTCLYYGYFVSRGLLRRATPRIPTSGSCFDSALLREIGVFTSQSLLKWLLTEGERPILKFSLSLESQDIFSVINNLGSLIARCLFQPIEDVSFSMFSRLAQRMKKEARATAHVLLTLVTLMVTIGLVFACFGPSYSALLLDILYRGSLRNTSAAACLAAYCVYVMFMAVNGVTEGFVYAVAPAADIKFLNRMLVVFSVVYVSCATLLLRVVGPVGLIIANCINMTMRIGWNSRLIRKTFAEHQRERVYLTLARPSALTLVFFVASLVATALLGRQLADSWKAQAIHVACGAACFVVTMAVSWKRDKLFWREVLRLFKGDKQA